VPEHKGIYAWYLKPNLSTCDINKLLEEIDEKKSPADKLIEVFLNKYIFNPLRETPYKIKLEGKLKPKYKGEVTYENPNSTGLISRLVQKPKLLFDIKKIFETVKHDLLSPIYIGMAKNLNVRLSKHVELMKKLRETEASFHPEYFSLHDLSSSEESALDHKFAHEVVVQRKLDINDLEVHVLELEFADDIQVDIENILNRLNYPLCGRN